MPLRIKENLGQALFTSGQTETVIFAAVICAGGVPGHGGLILRFRSGVGDSAACGIVDGTRKFGLRSKDLGGCK